MATLPVIAGSPDGRIVASSAQNGRIRSRSRAFAAASQFASAVRIAASSAARFAAWCAPHALAIPTAKDIVIKRMGSFTNDLLKGGCPGEEFLGTSVDD